MGADWAAASGSCGASAAAEPGFCVLQEPLWGLFAFGFNWLLALWSGLPASGSAWPFPDNPTETAVSGCPARTSGISPVLDMKKAGVEVGLGSDGPSSGNTLDLFTQFKMTACFQKTKYHDRRVFPAREIVELGTIGGARVLGAEQETGSLEPGKRADLVLVETSSANMFPLYNPYSSLVYSANASNVDSVWVQGRQLVGGKRLLHTDITTERSRLQERMGCFQKQAQKYQHML